MSSTPVQLKKYGESASSASAWMPMMPAANTQSMRSGVAAAGWGMGPAGAALVRRWVAPADCIDQTSVSLMTFRLAAAL